MTIPELIEKLQKLEESSPGIEVGIYEPESMCTDRIEYVILDEVVYNSRRGPLVKKWMVTLS